MGEDGVADLILLNHEWADFVGHKYGPESEELRVTLAEMDNQVARVLRALEVKVGKDYLLAVTADHGMPSLPPSPDHRHFTTTIAGLLHEKTIRPRASRHGSFPRIASAHVRRVHERRGGA